MNCDSSLEIESHFQYALLAYFLSSFELLENNSFRSVIRVNENVEAGLSPGTTLQLRHR